MRRMTNLWLDAVLLLVSVGFAQTLTAAGKEPKLEPAKKVVARGGLPNVARKLANGDDVSVVFIEFCVNDGNRDHTQHMERMVHKTWMRGGINNVMVCVGLM